MTLVKDYNVVRILEQMYLMCDQNSRGFIVSKEAITADHIFKYMLGYVRIDSGQRIIQQIDGCPFVDRPGKPLTE